MLSTYDEKALFLRGKFLGPYMAQSKTTMDGELGIIMNCLRYMTTWIS
jgi:hypothetical protein